VSDSTRKGLFGRVWNDPVWSKVISHGFIKLSGGAAAIGLLLALWLWTPVRQAAERCIAFLQTPSTLPNFLALGLVASLWALVLLVVGMLGVRWVATWERREDYLEDQYGDVIFRWRWPAFSGLSFRFFCPECDYEIIPFEPQHYGRYETIFSCQMCGKERLREQSSLAAINSALERMVAKKRRSEEWRHALRAARLRRHTRIASKG